MAHFLFSQSSFYSTCSLLHEMQCYLIYVCMLNSTYNTQQFKDQLKYKV